MNNNQLEPAKRIILPAGTQVERPNPPVIGYIRCGTTNPKTGKGMPLDYFHLMPVNKRHTSAIAEFTKLCGEHPAELFIYFLTSDMDKVVVNHLEAWEFKKKLAYGDGVVFRIKHPTRGTWVTLKKQDILVLPARDPIRQQWEYIEQRKLMHNHLQLKFFIKDYPTMGWFILSTSGKDGTIPNILDRLDSMKKALGSFHHMLFKMVLNVGHKEGTPIKYVSVDIQPHYSIEQITFLRKNIIEGQFNIDNVYSYIELQEYLETCGPKPTPLAPVAQYQLPEYTGEMDAGELGEDDDMDFTPAVEIDLDQEIDLDETEKAQLDLFHDKNIKKTPE